MHGLRIEAPEQGPEAVRATDLSAVRIHWLERFSNALKEVATAVSIAEGLKLEKVFLPRTPRVEAMFGTALPITVKGSGIVIDHADSPDMARHTLLSGRFFIDKKLRGLLRGSGDAADAIRRFRHGLAFDFGRDDALPEDELVIHIRSGDIFIKEKPNPK